jgi:squalene synthase HpnC
MSSSQSHILDRTWTVDASFRFCMHLAARHYENFPVASRLIAKDRRKHIAAIYAFARIADDFADEPGHTPAERIDALTGWEQQLIAAYAGQASHPVFLALAETADRFQIPMDLFTDLLTAFKDDVSINRFDSFDDLLEYSTHSANPIGRLLLLLFNYRSNQLHEWSDSICTALQLTNFWQDIAIDLQKDRIYLPIEDMHRFEYSEKDLHQKRMGISFRNLLAYEMSRTQDLFNDGKPLLNAVGKDIRLELQITWNGGMKILDKIRRNNYDVFYKRPQLSFADKASIFLSALRG